MLFQKNHWRKFNWNGTRVALYSSAVVEDVYPEDKFAFPNLSYLDFSLLVTSYLNHRWYTEILPKSINTKFQFRHHCQREPSRRVACSIRQSGFSSNSTKGCVQKAGHDGKPNPESWSSSATFEHQQQRLQKQFPVLYPATYDHGTYLGCANDIIIYTQI